MFEHGSLEELLFNINLYVKTSLESILYQKGDVWDNLIFTFYEDYKLTTMPEIVFIPYSEIMQDYPFYKKYTKEIMFRNYSVYRINLLVDYDSVQNILIISHPLEH